MFNKTDILKLIFTHYKWPERIILRRVIKNTILYSASLTINSTLCEKAALHGHRSKAKCLILLPNGNIATGSFDHTIRIWDKFSYECLYTLTGHYYAIHSLAVLPNGNIISGSADLTLRAWDYSKGYSCINTGYRQSNTIHCLLVLSNDLFVSGSSDLKVWDFNTLKCIKVLIGHWRAISCLILMQNGDFITSSWDLTIRIWEPNGYECIKVIKMESYPNSILNTAGGFMTGLENGSLHYFDQTYNTVKSSSLPCRVVSLLPLSDCLVIVGFEDGTLSVEKVDEKGYQPGGVFKALSRTLYDLVQLPSGDIITGLGEKGIKIWGLVDMEY
jgi:WD40 repeat protein